MLKMVYITSLAEHNAFASFPKIVSRIGTAPGLGDGESGSDSDEIAPYTEVWVLDSELAAAVKAWLFMRRAECGA